MRPLYKIHVSANVLPAVIVITFLMALGVLAILSLWEMESQAFVRNNHAKARRADVQSAFVLYRNHPDIYVAGTENIVRLYDSLEVSDVAIARRPWGLYEVVSVTSVSGRNHRTSIMGLRPPTADSVNFYYANNNGSLTVTGNTNLHGRILAPKNGIIYGQMRSVFFGGEKIAPNLIGISENAIPKPCVSAKKEIGELFALFDEYRPSIAGDSLARSFYSDETLVAGIPDGILKYCSFGGNVKLAGDRIRIDSTCTLDDVIVVGRRVTVGGGFRGTVQIFASDSLVLERGVCLEYPSGIYSGGYAELRDYAVVNGYAVVCAAGTPDVRNPDYRQSRLAKVRGMLYVDGNAQFQGVVSGPVYLSKALYYSPEGYYKDMIYDASVLVNTQMAMPLWFSSGEKREDIKWVR